jgi:secreted trypsin-like serine protease
MKRKFIHLVVLALTVVSSVATAIPASAVTYGDPVESPQTEFPEVVPVWVGGTSLCTGTLITQQVVLTAAHCVYGQAGPFQISVGGSTLNSGRLIDIDATWYHPRYDAKYKQNDIGLLHLKTPANVSRLGKLPSKSLKSVGKKFLIVGWGADQNGSITGKLNRLTLNNQTAASKKVFKGIYNPKTMIGAGRYFPNEILYGGGCTGDSGGPLYMGAKDAGGTVIGLTAFGASGCTVYKPTIFTRIDFYLAAIKRGISLLDLRAVAAPIASGRAAPSGIGTTTTTTTTIATSPPASDRGICVPTTDKMYVYNFGSYIEVTNHGGVYDSGSSYQIDYTRNCKVSPIVKILVKDDFGTTEYSSSGYGSYRTTYSNLGVSNCWQTARVSAYGQSEWSNKVCYAAP